MKEVIEISRRFMNYHANNKAEHLQRRKIKSTSIFRIVRHHGNIGMIARAIYIIRLQRACKLVILKRLTRSGKPPKEFPKKRIDNILERYRKKQRMKQAA